MDGESEIYHEYGIKNFLVQVYSKGTEEIKVEIAEMMDPTSAYGIYSFYRSPDLSRVEIGDEGSTFSNQVCFWQDRYYCRITAFGSGEVASVAQKLAKEISSRISIHAKVPEIIGLLPLKDRIKGSEKIIKGTLALNNQYYLFQEDLFGFKAKAVSAFAEYGKPENKIRLLVVEYLSADEARTAFNKIGEESKKRYTQYAVSRDDRKGIETLHFKTADKYVVLEKRRNLLAMVISADEVSGIALLGELFKLLR